jgi:hypothetical protein
VLSPSSSRHDDARDADLLADGRIERLLARYVLVILARCIHETKSSHDGQDVAQDVMFRLFREFHAGKRYPGIPYRVVVHQVTKWTLADFFAGRRTDVPLPDDLELREDDRGDRVVSDLWPKTSSRSSPRRSASAPRARSSTSRASAPSRRPSGSAPPGTTSTSASSTRASGSATCWTTMADADHLFDELAAAYVRGERPDLPAYVVRPGDDADELARLVDAFLRTVPPPEPSEDDVAVMRAPPRGPAGTSGPPQAPRPEGGPRSSTTSPPASRSTTDRASCATTSGSRAASSTRSGSTSASATPSRRSSRRASAASSGRSSRARGGSAMAYYRRTVSFDATASLQASLAPMKPAIVADADPAPAERDALDRLFLGVDSRGRSRTTEGHAAERPPAGPLR